MKFQNILPVLGSFHYNTNASRLGVVLVRMLEVICLTPGQVKG